MNTKCKVHYMYFILPTVTLFLVDQNRHCITYCERVFMHSYQSVSFQWFIDKMLITPVATAQSL